MDYLLSASALVSMAYLSSACTGTGILDTGCTASLIGSETLAQWSDALHDIGLNIKYVSNHVSFKGIGASQVVCKQSAIVPVCLGERLGQLKLSIIQDSHVPCLISVQAMKTLKMIIDLSNKTPRMTIHGFPGSPVNDLEEGQNWTSFAVPV